jgi:hypothetical protein
MNAMTKDSRITGRIGRGSTNQPKSFNKSYGDVKKVMQFIHERNERITRQALEDVKGLQLMKEFGE